MLQMEKSENVGGNIIIDNNETEQPFTYLNKKGDQVSMVDVGNKEVTQRVAVARSSVVFPPEVMKAFGITKNKCWEIYLKEKCEDHALRCCEQSLVILKLIEACNDYAWSVYQGLGECLIHLKQHQEAITCLNKACKKRQRQRTNSRLPANDSIGSVSYRRRRTGS